MGSEARARLGMAGLLMATLLSFSQLFARQDFFGPAALGVALATGIAMGARRRGLGPLPTVGVSSAAAVWYLVIVFRAADTFYGLPTFDALAGLGGALGRAFAQSQFDIAPIPGRPGYVIMVTVGMWAAATLGELATFRWRQPILASLPCIALFSEALVIGTRAVAPFWVALFLVALLAYWGLESSHGLRAWGRWVSAWPGHDDEGPSTVTASIARRMGASTVAVALIAPVFFPLFGGELLTWRTGAGAGGAGAGQGTPTGLVDPFVSVRPRITDQTDVPMFTVRAESPSYWRLVTLENFDGTTWNPQAFNGFDLPSGGFDAFERLPFGPEARTLTQTFSISGLDGGYLPAAVQAVDMPTGSPVYNSTRIDPSSGYLRTTSEVAEGLIYSVTSNLPDVGYRQLRRVTTFGHPDDTLTELPEPLAPAVGDLLQRWTEGAPTPFDELLAIQERLRGFTYTLEVEPRASQDYLAEFLTTTRAGYCQQFATAFAVLARALGFPARVSVGFLPGRPTPEAENVFEVRGTDAHAWPEIFFGRYGWIAFEPTPRADFGAEPPPYSEPPSPTVASGLGPGGRAAPGGLVRPNNTFEFTGNPALGNVPASPLPSLRPRGGTFQWERTFARISVVALVLTLAFLVIVPASKALRVRLRYGRAAGPMALAAAAFAEFQEEAGELASPRGASESAVAYGRRIAARRRVPLAGAARLARIYEAAEYARAGVGQGDADEARALAGELKRKLWATASWWDRLVRLFSVRGAG